VVVVPVVPVPVPVAVVVVTAILSPGDSIASSSSSLLFGYDDDTSGMGDQQRICSVVSG
jgi:hypothetical protein